MQIRPLEFTNAVMYREIRLKALQTCPEAFSSSYEEELVLPIEKIEGRLKEEESFTFGAWDNSDLIGVVTLVIEKKKKLKHRANIVAMYVCPEKRKSGVGKKLMQEAIKKASELNGIEQIYLAVTSNNIPAQSLYKSLGFQTYGIDKRALKIENEYFDDELMMLFI